MNRHLTTHDITWFLEADRNNQLDLDPSYQRRSVWTRSDQQFFLDTIFRGYPSPAIFLHKTVDENGRPTFHVVDGKQRIRTVLDFVAGQVKIADDFGDIRLNAKRWSDLRGENELRTQFWNYKFVVEELSFEYPSIVNDIFDRINRNARKLTRQELRHAKYGGWFITQVEREADSPYWTNLGVVTQTRAKRMSDSQFLSELLLVILEHSMRGFDQDALDDAYAKYDDISAEESLIDEAAFTAKFFETKDKLLKIETHNNVVTTDYKTLANLYTLWSILVLEAELPEMDVLADRLKIFMDMMKNGSETAGSEDVLGQAVRKYADNLKGASTDSSPRIARYDALIKGLMASYK